MPLNAYGVIGSIDDTHLSPIWRAMMNARSDEFVQAGLVVTPTPATPYSVTISTGQGIEAGVYTIASTGPFTATTTPKASAPRIDRIVLQIDWDAARTAYNNPALTTEAARTAAARTAAPSFIAVPGAPALTPSPPGLIRTAGTKWQMPLARVLVRTDLVNGQFLTSDITPEHPYQPEKTCSGTATLNPALVSTGVYTDLITIPLPLGFFASNVYRVTFSEGTGTAVGHEKHLWWGNKTTTSFTIGINTDTPTPTTVDWQASGY